MKYTELGNTGIEVSRICVGGMSFGRVQETGHQWLLDKTSCKEMIAHAYELGVNFIDTANSTQTAPVRNISVLPLRSSAYRAIRSSSRRKSIST